MKTNNPRLLSFLLTALALIPFGTAQALIINSLPYSGTPDWTDHTGAGASMVATSTESTLTTANNQGVWFGWGPSSVYGDQPAWTPADNTGGNYFKMTASFSSDAADWSAYFYDGTHAASFSFAPTGCNGNISSCYGITGNSGINIYYNGQTSFHSIDLTLEHTFEFLLKDGLVSYWMDGTNLYSGASAAAASPFYPNPLLVIGDGSGTTRTGQGVMTIKEIVFETHTSKNVQTVPSPATLALLALGLAGIGYTRSRKA